MPEYKRHALYIIGEPGVGKSTLVEALTVRAPLPELHTHPFVHRHHPNGVVELGARRTAFSGTDSLGMAVQPKAIAYLRDPDCPDLLLAEGDRLGNDGFLTALWNAGFKLHLYHLRGARAAERRRLQRQARLGLPPQDVSWVKGRQTKAEGLAARRVATTLDASLPVDLLLRCLTDPVAMAFRELQDV